MSKTKAKTVADFKSLHDDDVRLPAKIKEALTTLAAEGPEAWEYEADFLKRAGVSTTQLATYRGQFEKFFVAVRDSRTKNEKRVWFGDSKVADKVR